MRPRATLKWTQKGDTWTSRLARKRMATVRYDRASGCVFWSIATDGGRTEHSGRAPSISEACDKVQALVRRSL